MPAQDLRDYQQDGIERILAEFRAGRRRVLATAPTGSGKTTIFSWLSAQAKTPVVILVHRRELATQAADRLREFGVPHGFIMAGMPRNPAARVQVASVQTLVRRQAPKAGLVICDEAHLSTAKTWTSILENYPNAKILGVTATPWRLAGKPLVGEWDSGVIVAKPAQLREQGHLCGYNGFSYKTPDLSGVKTTGGDYNEKQSGEAMREPQIVANIVEQWLAHASTLSTVVFAVTVEHSLALTAEFKAAGVRAEHLDGKTSHEARKAILKRVSDGVTQVLCNVGVAVEGLDIPRLKCCVLARPTKSLARAIQMMGRVRRPWGGLTARIHDHAFNIKLHGLPDADRDYTLSSKPVELPSLTQCETCMALYSGPTCTACGLQNEPKPQGERVLTTVADGEQVTFSSEQEAAAAEWAAQDPGPILQPVRVDWSDRQIGKMIEGIFERTWEIETSYGKSRQYYLRGENGKRDHTFAGTKQLDRKMKDLRSGDRAQVTYKGRREGTTGLKEFSVAVDRAEPGERVCAFETCGRPHFTKGLCAAHHQQRQRGQELTPITLRDAPGTHSACTFEGCDKPHVAKGLCVGHRQQLRRGERLAPLLAKGGHYERASA